MVLRLKKPGQAILDSLTPHDCDLIHMAGCLPGEAAELWDAVEQNSVELVEELGDFAFYLVATRHLFGFFEWTGVKAVGTRSHAQPLFHATEIMRLSGHLWDVVKRIVIYRKSPLVPDSKYQDRTLGEVAIELLDQIEHRFNGLLAHYGYQLDAILEANYEKLAGVDKGRYASGSYSDAQAQDRRDKR